MYYINLYFALYWAEKNISSSFKKSSLCVLIILKALLQQWEFINSYIHKYKEYKNCVYTKNF